MSGNLAKDGENSEKKPKVRKRSGNLFSWENLIVAAEQNNCYFIHTVIHFSYVMFTENSD